LQTSPNHTAPKPKAVLHYTPFGSIMVGVSKGEYRYGFNGMEKDTELKGEGNSLDFGARIYDSRLGRWLSRDPLMSIYPSLSPYHGIGNNPILFKDIDGKKILFAATQGSEDHVAWSKFSTVIENKFDNLVTVSRGEFVKVNTEVGKNAKGETVHTVRGYYEVGISFNNDAIHERAVKNLGESATPQLILDEEKRIKKGIAESSAYQTLGKMINSPTKAMFNVFVGGVNEGGFAGLNKGVQQIDIGFIQQLDKVEELGAFSVLFHELVEGHSFTEQKDLNKIKAGTGNLTYKYSHLKAIVEQCKDLGVLYISADRVGYTHKNGHVDPFPQNTLYTLQVVIYSENNGSYSRTTVSVNVKDGKFEEIQTNAEAITKKDFESEKKKDTEKM